MSQGLAAVIQIADKYYSDAPLNCGLHNCIMRCHRVEDHSKMPCPHKVERICERGHKLKMPCHMRNDKCRTCAREDIETERRIKRDLKLEAERQAREAAYRRELQEIQDEADHERRRLRYRKDEEEQQKTLAQQRADLAALRKTAERVLKAPKAQARQNMPGSFPGVDPPTPPTDADLSGSLQDLPDGAAQEWQYLKQFEGAKSEPLDQLVGMIGLEEVKSEFLCVKSKVDTAIRQGITLCRERFGCSMLGNPGTGKYENYPVSLRRHPAGISLAGSCHSHVCCGCYVTDSVLQGKPPLLVSMLNSLLHSASFLAAVSKKRLELVSPTLAYLAARAS